MVQIVDVDVEPRKEVGRMVIEGRGLGCVYFGGEYEEFDVGKEIKSVFGWFVYSHSFSL